MVKIFKLKRIISYAQANKNVQKCWKYFFGKLKINAAITRMIMCSIIVILITHVFACLWFLTAKFNDFHPDTWVARLGLQDSDPGIQYLYSMHWAS
jgi:hypothetical protein